jgi:hypothetical protein
VNADHIAHCPCITGSDGLGIQEDKLVIGVVEVGKAGVSDVDTLGILVVGIEVGGFKISG